LKPGAAALAALALTACATLPPAGLPPAGLPTAGLPAAGLPARAELGAVPFFAQRESECGPAALAMLLDAGGLGLAPEELVPEVYLPGRRGTLQLELVAATRRHGRIPYPLRPDVNALYTELAAGRPVLVLQNYGSRRAPQWHYAVVVGYEPGHLLLRSGVTRRLRLPLSRFLGTWERADAWALVALAPGELPATAEPEPYLAAVSGLEALGQAAAARAAFAAATVRWPGEPLAWLGLGNSEAARGDAAAGEAALRRALELAPRSAAARNNLAELLGRRGCPAAARIEIEQASADAAGTSLAPAVALTARELAALPAADAPGCPAP